MLFVFVVFIALIVLLNAWLYRPLLQFMEKREKMLQKESSKLQAGQERIKELYHQSHLVVDRAKEEARLIRLAATQEATAKYKKKLEEVRHQAEERFLKLSGALEEQRLLLREELRENVPLFKQTFEDKIKKIGE